MKVRFFKAVYNEYDRSSEEGVYRVKELFDASEIFEDMKFEYVDFAQSCTSSDIEEDILAKDTPFVQDENFKHFKDAVYDAESIFCYGESGGTSFCNYFIINIAY